MKNIITIILILIVPALIYSLIKKDSPDINSAIAKDNGLPSIITFSSTMCLDCQKMKPIIQEAEKEYQGKINFIYVNATDKKTSVKLMIKKYSVLLVPTMVLLDKDQKEIKKIEGAISKEELTKELEGLVNG